MTTTFADRQPEQLPHYMLSKQLWSNPSVDSIISAYQASSALRR